MDTDILMHRGYSGIGADVAIVVIGRNEGQRLVDCLNSLKSHRGRTVYVDSASTDGSAQAAAGLCAEVVRLDMTIPFTAARARNAGFDAVMRRWPDTIFVQFLDGDCELDTGWIATATTFLVMRKDVALVFGRRRERYPERTIFNAMCDREWDGVPGEAQACGGDVLIRASVLKDLGGYSGGLIAGEEPELCVRLRERGWKIWRLPSEMTRHDADISRLSQWWRRSVRCGHAYAQVSHLHRTSPSRIWTRNLRRAVFWGGLLPLVAIAGAVFHPAALALLLLYPLQLLRLARRARPALGNTLLFASFDVLGKFPEMQGVAQFYLNRLINRRQRIIEYK
ncbi:glycosyltransferase [Neorhizobium galegae]|uniref:glycosyltransferase family 2 protein n=1 Tax=Neorhizobium galegae TaxID=399 RepID=UPI0006222A51|nr:glycosyltransferase [Neorhizobium galegae]MCQ1766626.1 glycosyltransferase [Neorhizobium galegae]MCQ1845748.1 glycosyltransferase [Neorhizobium galegae]CDZ35990.1 Putative glycosyltransferase [Neorhizobium galegae bv. officinalis]